MLTIKQALIDKQADSALRDLSKGDMDGLAVIYNLYGRLIRSVAYTIVGNYTDAEDVLQDVMILLARRATLYKGEGSARAYVMTITRNRSIDLVTRRKNDVSTDEIGDIPVRDAELAAVEVQDLLSHLSEEERQIVTLHVYVGLSHRQVAEMMGLTSSATEKKYQRALKKLKKQYES